MRLDQQRPLVSSEPDFSFPSSTSAEIPPSCPPCFEGCRPNKYTGSSRSCSTLSLTLPNTRISLDNPSLPATSAPSFSTLTPTIGKTRQAKRSRLEEEGGRDICRWIAREELEPPDNLCQRERGRLVAHSRPPQPSSQLPFPHIYVPLPSCPLPCLCQC